jgi:hypothetical protein
MGGEDDNAQAFALSAYYFIFFQLSLVYISHPRAPIADKGCHVVITLSLRIKW